MYSPTGTYFSCLLKVSMMPTATVFAVFWLRWLLQGKVCQRCTNTW